MVMPDSPGRNLRRLRQIDPGIGVLLSSGYSIDSQAREILARGCGRFIQKPYDLRGLSRSCAPSSTPGPAAEKASRGASSADFLSGPPRPVLGWRFEGLPRVTPADAAVRRRPAPRVSLSRLEASPVALHGPAGVIWQRDEVLDLLEFSSGWRADTPDRAHLPAGAAG